MDKILLQIAAELKVRPQQVHAAVTLLDGGATVPFIARYRKEATEGLDDTQLRELEARLLYLREMQDRREAILKSIDELEELLVDHLCGHVACWSTVVVKFASARPAASGAGDYFVRLV